LTDEFDAELDSELSDDEDEELANMERKK